MDIRPLAPLLFSAAFKAGEEILLVYNSPFAVEHKEDRSPLTMADKRSHETISRALQSTTIPLLSEEGKQLPWETRRNWDRFWLVDPLDGTKEFVKRNGEFTVNIALIEDGAPVFGVIYVPVTDTWYWGGRDTGSFTLEALPPSRWAESWEDAGAAAQKLPLDQPADRPFTVVGSRSHMSAETETFIESMRRTHGSLEMVSRGSSLKLCMVARGDADVYPRFAPTMEWDTGAGQAICEGAGVSVTFHDSSLPLHYNKENLVNPWFLVGPRTQ